MYNILVDPIQTIVTPLSHVQLCCMANNTLAMPINYNTMHNSMQYAAHHFARNMQFDSL